MLAPQIFVGRRHSAMRASPCLQMMILHVLAITTLAVSVLGSANINVTHSHIAEYTDDTVTQACPAQHLLVHFMILI